MAGYTPEMKLPEQESDSNTRCSAIFYLLQSPLLIPQQTGSAVDLKQTPADLHLIPHTARYTPETKLPEQESDSNTCYSAIFYLLQPPLLIPRQTGSGVDLKQSPTDLQLRVLTVRRKTNKQKGHSHQNPISTSPSSKTKGR